MLKINIVILYNNKPPTERILTVARQLSGMLIPEHQSTQCGVFCCG